MKLKLPSKSKSAKSTSKSTKKDSFSSSKLSNIHLVGFVFIFAIIGGFLLYRSFAAAPVVASIEGESMSRPTNSRIVEDTSASLGKAVLLTADGNLDSRFSLAAPSETLNLKIKSTYCGNNVPKYRVKVDGQIVATTSIIKKTSWYERVVSTRLSSGLHTLSIEVFNVGGGTPGSAECSKSFYLDNAVLYGSPTTAPPPVAPTLAFSANPTSVPSGSSSTLTWATTNATACIAAGDWSGDKPVQGSASTGALTRASAYRLTCTGSGGSVSASVDVGVTAAPNPPPPNPTPTPPPSSGNSNCLVSNRTSWALGGTDCRVGSTITRTNQAFNCTQPLANYGTLPLKVVIVSTQVWDAAGAVTLDGGCSGDNNPDTIDIIVDIRGDGPNSNAGNTHDAFKTRTAPGPQNVQVTGVINCGYRSSTAHQDGIQIQGGSNLAFVNIKMGDYQNGRSTCQGAGGAFFYSINNPSNVDILGGEYIACNHGLLGDIGTGHNLVDVKFRSGRNDGSDPNCNFSSGGACTQYTGLSMSNVRCGNWNASSDTWNDTTINN